MSEQKEKFVHLLTLCNDYATARLAFTTAERAAEAIQGAVAEGIRAAKAQTAERVAVLERMVQDGSRPASACRVWRQEFDRLRGRTFSATPDEAAAFDTEMAAAQEAVEDMRRLQGEIREAISAVNGAITELRAQTLGDPVTGLWETAWKVYAKPLRRFAGRWAHEQIAVPYAAVPAIGNPSRGAGRYERRVRA